MNVVFDAEVSISHELRTALYPILPKGTIPLMLDRKQGIKGTFDEKEGVIFITNLPIDILRYHGAFFEKYKNVPQWFMILLNKNDHGIMLLKNAAIKYNMQNCKIYQAYTGDALSKIVSEILSSRKAVSGKVLLLSKHKKASVPALASFLFEDDKERYDIRTSMNAKDTDAAVLLLCGQEEKDFIGLDIPEGMNPYFVLLNPEWEVQQFLNSDSLVQRLSEVYGMTADRIKERMFFVSTNAEQWYKTKSEGANAIQQGILLWDEFGLPLSRSAYTCSNINKFLTNTFCCSRLKELFT